MNIINYIKNNLDKIWKFILYSLLIFFAVGISYVWYTDNYLPTNYGVKTIGTVYKKTQGRKSTVNVHYCYKVNGKVYYDITEINSFEYKIGREVEIGEKFYVLYYPPNPEYAKIDEEDGILP